MSKSTKKYLAWGLLFLLVICTLPGCSSKKNADKNGTVREGAGGEDTNTASKAMGRYVENEIALPRELAEEKMILFQNNPEGAPFLLSMAEGESSPRFYQYTLQEDQTWKREESVWLNSQGMNPDNLTVDAAYGEDGRLYAVWNNFIDSDDKPSYTPSRVIVSKDGKTAQTLTIPFLEEEAEPFGAVFITNIDVLKNGNLLLSCPMMRAASAYLVDQSTGEVIKEITLESSGNYATQDSKLAVKGDTIYLLSGNGDSISLIDGKTGEAAGTLPAEVKNVYETSLAADREQGLAMLNSDGISLLKNGSDLWETLVEGSSNTMGSPNYYGVGFLCGRNKDYYVMYNSMSSPSKLVRYTFAADMPTEPDTVLTVYSLNDNNTLRYAAIEFQSQNPNVKVDVQTVITDDSSALSEDYIRSFNTELLNGKGPDIILLDGLPVESYIEKGVLEDLSEVMDPLTASGDFLPNLARACKTDGGLYAVPLRMGLPMAFGEKEPVSMAGDLEKLSAYIDAHPDQAVFGTLNKDDFVTRYFTMQKNALIDEKNRLNGEALKAFLENTKNILEASGVSDQKKEIWPDNEWDLIEKNQLLFTTVIKGVFNSESCLSVTRQSGKTMAGINGVFFPYGKIGLNKAGKNKELAKKFLQTLFSSKIQQADFYDGFPVSENALKAYQNTENHTADAEGGSIVGADGKHYDYNMTWPTKEQLSELTSICKSVNTMGDADSRLVEMFLQETDGYYSGSKSLDETLTALTNKMQTFLTE